MVIKVNTRVQTLVHINHNLEKIIVISLHCYPHSHTFSARLHRLMLRSLSTLYEYGLKSILPHKVYNFFYGFLNIPPIALNLQNLVAIWCQEIMLWICSLKSPITSSGLFI